MTATLIRPDIRTQMRNNAQYSKSEKHNCKQKLQHFQLFCSQAVFRCARVQRDSRATWARFKTRPIFIYI